MRPAHRPVRWRELTFSVSTYVSHPKTLTSRDIARLAGVSQTTVSRVLQGSALVRPDTRKAVLEVIGQAGYMPSAAARSMRTRRSLTVALVVANLALNPLYPALLQLLFSALRERGLDASVWEAESFDEHTVRALAESSVDGVIVATAVDSAQPYLAELRQRKPIVLVNRKVASARFDQYTSDNLGGGAAVADYFQQGGRTRPALIAADSDASTIMDRESGYLRSLGQHGMKIAKEAVARVSHFSYEAGYSAAEELISRYEPDCIFCVNDIVAIGALDALKAHGVDVPATTWVVGYDDVPMCAWGCIQLTTVRQPLEAMAHGAVERLCNLLDGDSSTPQLHTLPNEIVRRATSS